MAMPALTHVAFNCPDVEAMATFYHEYAGLDIVHDREDAGIRVAWLGHDRENPSFVFVLIQGDGNQPVSPPAMEHLGFACATREDVDAVAAKARKNGVEILQGPVQWPPPVGYFVILADPNGNRVEFSYGQPINPREL